jgi:glycosyltransferase involved in cell wall biosynthesis
LPERTTSAKAVGLRVLVLAPHPFFIDRGTPIDLGLVLRAFSLRGDAVDLVCYSEGEDVSLPNLRIHRIPARSIFRLSGMRPGFSLRKVLADWFLFRAADRLMRANRYDVIHAGEEAVFIARWLGRRHRVPYVYDLDSSVAQQMVEKMPWLRPFGGIFNALERGAIRGALGCLPVCNALGDLCRDQGARDVEVLHDITLLDEEELEHYRTHPRAPLRKELGVTGTLAMYVGNLEPYQGVDLLLNAMALAAPSDPTLHLAVAGGRADDIAKAKRRIQGTPAEKQVHFLGPRPVTDLARLLLQADLLVAPRIRGLNTPMKVFSYLHTGRCVLATDLPTHTQVLTPEVCALAPANPEGFAECLLRLSADPERRERLGAAGRRYVLEHHSFDAYRARFDRFYGRISAHLETGRAVGAANPAAADH